MNTGNKRYEVQIVRNNRFLNKNTSLEGIGEIIMSGNYDTLRIVDHAGIEDTVFLRKEVRKNESMMLKLYEGKTIVVEEFPRAKGAPYPSEVIFRKHNKFYVRELICTQSEFHGLGSCKCRDHETFDIYEITKEQAQRKMFKARTRGILKVQEEQ